MGTSEVDADALLSKKEHDWTGFPIGMKIGHLHFMGNDLDVADHFFLDFLQMDLVTDMHLVLVFIQIIITTTIMPLTYGKVSIELRHLDEAGIVSWQVIVDEKYFSLLVTRAKDMPGLRGNTNDQIDIIDPMGSLLTIIHD